MDLRALGRWLLVPASVVFTIRALLASGGADLHAIPGLGPITGITGALALPGILLFWWGSRKSEGVGIAHVALACVLIGHFVFRGALDVIGPAFVYLGSGLAGRHPLGVAGGMVAMAGALLRADYAFGHVLVAIGAAATAVSLIQAARAKA